MDKMTKEKFETNCGKLGYCAELLETLEHNLSQDTMTELDKLKTEIVRGDCQKIIDSINRLEAIKADWINYRDTQKRLKETLMDQALKYLDTIK